MIANAAMTVAREIPLEFILGQLVGRNKICGGVIRNAQGQIIRHLALAAGAPATALMSLTPQGMALNVAMKGAGVASEILANVQLLKLSKDVGKLSTAVASVMDVSVAGMALSGIGAVTSIAGVAYLSGRLNQIDRKVDAIARDVKDVKDWLTGLQRSQLHFAVGTMSHAETTDDLTLRKDLLLQSKQTFSTLTHQYRDQWERCRTTVEVKTLDDLYTLSMIGHATVCSNLGMGGEAASGLRTDFEDWQRQARTHARALLFSDHPERLLSAEYVEELPTNTIIGLLDFAHDTERGVEWIDDLRSASRKSGGLPSRLPGMPRLPGQRVVQKEAQADLVSAAAGLMARADVLDANVAHYDFLKERKMTATAFQKQLEEAIKDTGASAICVEVPPLPEQS